MFGNVVYKDGLSWERSPDERTVAPWCLMKLRFLILIVILAVTTQPVTPQQAPEPPAKAHPSPAPGQVADNLQDGLKYVWVPPGTFMMGCSPGDIDCQQVEKPAHNVSIRKGF